MMGSRTKHVAIVDDDKNLRESLQDLLETAGFDSRLYESADAFLMERGYLEAACILADVRMPGMSGVDLLLVLREMGRCPPTVILTSYSDEHTRQAAMDRGAAAFLTKPVESAILLETVAAAVQAWDAERPSQERDD